MKSVHLIFTVLCVIAVLGGGLSYQVMTSAAAALPGPQDVELSTYWNHNVRRWDTLIIQEAQRRGLDPDFLASVVWVESNGNPDAISHAGAVGLMQVMPKEAGFSWRPTQAELLNPFTNLYWGTRTISIVIHQGQGDVFSALAAYNGGWDKTHQRGPRYLATQVLRDYATAVAQRHGVSGRWIAHFAVRDLSIRGPIWVADSERDDVYFYGAENRVLEGGALIPMRAPTAMVARCQDAAATVVYDVGLWLYDVDNGVWVGETIHTLNALMTFAAAPATVTAVSTPAPIVTPTPVSTVMSSAPLPIVPATTPVVTPEVAASLENLPALPPCNYEALWADAWPLRTEKTVDGWKATLFAQGHNGNCEYTYYWNTEEEFLGGPMQESVLFEVQSARQDGAIVGTVLVKSGDALVRVGVYVASPHNQ